MRGHRVLVANRGEIAIRIARTARELGLGVVAVASEDELDAPHLRAADEVVPLPGVGPRAYLGVETVVAAAVGAGCRFVHPGYGFLSERAELAAACLEAGLVFVGPSAATLERFGDKAAARALAEQVGVPVIPGTGRGVTLTELAAFLEEHGASGIMLKAVAGGGGRGLRVVRAGGELAEAYERARSEARAAFGVPDLYAEQLVADVRHVEVQVAADRQGTVVVLGDRDCSLQRRHQKLIEFGPAPGLTTELRSELHSSAVALIGATELVGLATVEYLVPVDPDRGGPLFLEVNPRLQVEHTVTEAVTGLDLVALQFALAEGADLAVLGVTGTPEPRGLAVQLRVCLETYGADGAPAPSGGTITAFQPPIGPGVRVDTFAEPGLVTSPAYDSLLAKLVVHTPMTEFTTLLAKAGRALGDLVVDGVATNTAALARILADHAVGRGAVPITHLESHPDLLAGAEVAAHPAAVRVGLDDPLAVLRVAARPAGRAAAVPDPGLPVVPAPVPGTVVGVLAEPGQVVERGAPMVIVESMKMEHVVAAPQRLRVVRVLVTAAANVAAGAPLVQVELLEATAETAGELAVADLDEHRPDLVEVLDRHAVGLDEHRPEAVARRRDTGSRTARENVADLLDPGSFVEYAPLVVAAQRRRRSLDDLIRRTPADGLVGGVGTVNGSSFAGHAARVVALSYDYTVLAGTQGLQNHRKKDRLFELAERLRLPVVLFAEGGGGRPGDTDGIGGSGLDCLAFHLFGRLSGLVPLVGITSGYCFAGNAALLGTCDVVIATEGSNIGMGGPAMIEGGGLGVFHPSEIGPVEVQRRNGVVDLVVPDEEAAVAAAKRYLSYFQGPLDSWEAADQRLLRHSIPENRLRVYDIRTVVDQLCDTGSVLELRRGFGDGMLTALVRFEGRPVGLVANDPTHLGGAIDAAAAEKAARFMQLCDAHDLPIVFLCDTPGFMVGPEAEAEALVRKAARLFVMSGSLTVPFMTVVLRKGYGLGAQAMAGGSFRAPLFTVAWPTGEFGGMGLEGAVKLGYRKELEAITDPVERRAAFDEMVARLYEHGKAVNAASAFEIDEVIDPADTRRWVMAMLEAAPPVPARSGKKRPCVDTW